MSAMTLSIRLLSSEAEIPDALWQACFPPPLEGRWWYRALEHSGINDQFEFSYALIEQNGAAVGIAPIFVMNAPVDLVMPPAIAAILRFFGHAFPSLRYQRMLFAGSPCSDEGTVGLLPTVDRSAVFQALHVELLRLARRARAGTIIWKDCPEEYRESLQAVAQRHGLFELVSFPGTMLPLKSNNKADWFAGMKGSRRHQVKKKLRLSRERVALATEVINGPGPAVLDEVFGLFNQTYEKSATKFERLTREFFTRIAAEPVSYFILLREPESGALVAFMLCFHVGDGVINKFIGLDYARPREWLLYFRLFEAALDWSLSVNARSLQSGQTGYAAKIELGHRLVPLTNYCRHRNPLMNFIYRLVARTISWKTLDPDLARHLLANPDEPRAA